MPASARARRARYYPILLDLYDRPVVVIGGGPIATRKAAALLAAGARLTVISPSLTPSLARLAREGRIRHRQRRYQRGDLKGVYLAVAATSMPDEQLKVVAESRTTATLVNVVDQPTLCDFIAPAVITRGDLIIAVSTGGRSPALARWLKAALRDLIGKEYGRLTQVLGQIRVALRKAGRPPSVRTALVDKLMASPLLSQIRDDDHAAATRTIRHITGLTTFTLPRSCKE